jgi:hypothetical protein
LRFENISDKEKVMKHWILLITLVASLATMTTSLAVAYDGEYGDGAAQQSDQTGEITDVSSEPTEGGNEQAAPPPPPRPVTVNNYNNFVVVNPTPRRTLSAPRKPKSDGAAYLDCGKYIVKILNGNPVYLGGITVNKPAPVIHKELKMDNNGLFALLGTLGIIALVILALHVRRDATTPSTTSTPPVVSTPATPTPPTAPTIPTAPPATPTPAPTPLVPIAAPVPAAPTPAVASDQPAEPAVEEPAAEPQAEEQPTAENQPATVLNPKGGRVSKAAKANKAQPITRVGAKEKLSTLAEFAQEENDEQQ